VSVATANGFAGSVANPTTTPAITISTTVTGILSGNGTAVAAAVSGTNLKTVNGTSIIGAGDIATPQGTVTASGGALTANAVVLGNGTTDVKVSTGITTDGTAKLILGVNTTTLGTVKMFGNTSGDATIQPTAVAGTATVQTLPATTGTLVNRVTTAAGVSATNSDGALTFALGAIVPTTVNGNTITTGTGTLTLAASKTLTCNNNITLAGTDGKTLTLTNGLTVTTNDGTLAFGAASKTLTVNKSLTLDGTDSTTMTFPSTTATIARTDAAQTFTGLQTMSQILTTPATISVSSNAGTVTRSNRINNFTNSSAATMTITMSTTSATDGDMVMVVILDFSGVAQTITWVNTENSTVTAPTTSNGSTTLPLTVGFKWNSLTSKWRVLASA
jgi:hypothetical protein